MSTTKNIAARTIGPAITITTPFILIALLRNNKLSPITYTRFKYTFTILTHLLNINLTNFNADVARPSAGWSSPASSDLAKLKFFQYTPLS